jgi:hypothetical protein
MTSIQVERGTITKNSEIEVVGLGNNFKTTLTGIGAVFFDTCYFNLLFIHFANLEMFHKELDRVRLMLVQLIQLLTITTGRSR